MTTRYKGYLVIDIGGTLFDAYNIGLSMLNNLSKEKKFTPESVEKAASKFPNHSFSYLFLNETVMSILFPDSDPRDTLSIYRNNVLRALKKIKHVRRTFNQINNLGYHCIIATNGTLESTHQILKALSLSTIIATNNIFVSEQFRKLKSSGLIHIAIRNKYPKALLWGVGNSIQEDIIPALDANMKAVWVTEYCRSSELNYKPLQGVIKIHSFKLLPNLLKNATQIK